MVQVVAAVDDLAAVAVSVALVVVAVAAVDEKVQVGCESEEPRQWSTLILKACSRPRAPSQRVRIVP